MIKRITSWTVSQLSSRYDEIYFPEYQREPNIWRRDAKQRLIDSMMRRFDIAPIYMTEHKNGIIECVDGRQRTGAIMAFLGRNDRDVDVGFDFRVLNELYDDGEHPFVEMNHLSYRQIAERPDVVAAEFIRRLESYQMTVVILSEVRDDNEFNLQFARLNLGMIINSGEKLNAMVGDLGDVCFRDLAQHPFLGVTSAPERRYGREQTVAQILAHVFSIERSRGRGRRRVYARTRYFDLQRLFKAYTTMGEEEWEWVEKLRTLFDRLVAGRDNFVGIRSRAMLVSTVMLAYTEGVGSEEEAWELSEFIRELITRLKWQLSLGLDVDPEYRYLVEQFQKYLTQASVEKAAVTGRATLLAKEYARWKDTSDLRGDMEYRARKGEDPFVVSMREIGE